MNRKTKLNAQKNVHCKMHRSSAASMMSARMLNASMLVRLLLTVFLLPCLLMTGCTAGSVQQTQNAAEKNDKQNDDKQNDDKDIDDRLKIVCTVFPEYDWTRVVLGERLQDVELICLLDNGADLHSFQPSVQDITDIADCDVFIRIGGESEKWTDDALAEAINSDMKVLTMLDALGERAREEESVEGMQVREEESDDEEEGPELDEHVWMNLENARVLSGAICDVLSAADPEHADIYKNNTEAYQDKLLAADNAYRKVISDADKDTVVFADRFPFRYLADEYGLKYYAAFSGCSAETEAGFDTIVFLAQKMDELDLGSIFIIENSSDAIARTVIANTKRKDQQILVMNSMQSVQSSAMADTSYLKIMYENLDALKTALQ